MSDGYNEYEDYGDYEEVYDDYPETNKVEEKPSDPRNMVYEKKKSMIFVTIDDIKTLIKNKCDELNELLGLPKDEALIIYNYFQWRKDRVESEWFGNEDEIRKKAGVDPVEKAEEDLNSELRCPMCFDLKKRSEIDSLACNHYICKDCLGEYIEYNVCKPEKGFFWKCPFAGCNMVIPDSMNLKYLSEDKKHQYYKKMGVAYADNSKSLRWCPAPDCNYGVENESITARSITCPCNWVFCFKCGLEDHQPCDCEGAREWLKRDQGGGANAKWLLAYTKDCPKCKRAIEKNQGCNYMRCRHPGCNFEFCWLCLADWKTHNDHFKCNKYDKLSTDEKKAMDDEKQKERSELQKYAFYYERYQNNNLAMKSADKILATIKAEQKDIAIKLMLTLTQLEFLSDACLVLRNAKRVLKWSYAYGFYLNNDLQRNLYEIIQEKLDIYSSELHVLLEKKYEEAKHNIGDFTSFKDAVLASVYKCKQSQTAFLEKMEEFENAILEEELKQRQMKEQEEKIAEILDQDSQEEKKKGKGRGRGKGKRKADELTNADENKSYSNATKNTKLTKNNK